jgi:glycosyltransferase involved in cell wall biosynthesis
MTKIIQIVTQMEAGGAQRVALWLADGLSTKGYDVEVWYLYKKRPLDHENVKTVVFFDGKPSKIADVLLIIRRMAASLRNSRSDVIITHTHYSNIVCQFFAWIFKVPKRIAVQHNPLSTYPLLARYLDPLYGTLGIYTQIVAVSQSVAEALAKTTVKYQKNMTVIYNGVPGAPSSKSADVMKQREMLGLPGTSFMILNVGRLSHQKNQEFLLKLLQLQPDYHLVIVGEGELRAYLESLAKELCVSTRVTFAGEVPYKEVRKFYEIADVFAFPSHFESFGLALVEAMRSELPVLASDIPAVHEIIGTSGYILPLIPGEWVSAMKELEDNETLRRELGAKGKVRSDKFSVDTMVSTYEKLF